MEVVCGVVDRIVVNIVLPVDDDMIDDSRDTMKSAVAYRKSLKRENRDQSAVAVRALRMGR